jgi:hypothetical protein
MAYVKLPRASVDYEVGLQTINQARDNAEALRDAWGAKHGLSSPGLGFSRATGLWPYFGRHNDPRLTRGVLRARIGGSLTNGVTVSATSTSQCFTSLARQAAGRFRITVGGLGYFRAHACVVYPVGGGGVVPLINCRYDTSTGSSTPGLTIETRSGVLGAASFVLTDIPFCVFLVGFPS